MSVLTTASKAAMRPFISSIDGFGFMAMGAPDGGHELVTRRVSSNAGRPPKSSHHAEG